MTRFMHARPQEMMDALMAAVPKHIPADTFIGNMPVEEPDKSGWPEYFIGPPKGTESYTSAQLLAQGWCGIYIRSDSKANRLAAAQTGSPYPPEPRKA